MDSLPFKDIWDIPFIVADFAHNPLEMLTISFPGGKVSAARFLSHLAVLAIMSLI